MRDARAVKVMQHGCVIRKNSDYCPDYSSIVGDTPLKTGRHHWEVDPNPDPLALTRTLTLTLIGSPSLGGCGTVVALLLT